MFPNKAVLVRVLAQRIVGRLIVLAVTIVCASGILQADPSIPHLFSDHMVLQREMGMRVWGWADPGEKIEVAIARDSGETVAGSDRRWEVTLPPMEAGGPYVLAVRGKTTIEIKDVMIGEVWVASGQSNMTFALSSAANAAEALAGANRPQVRLFVVPGRVSLTQQADTRLASWKVCTPEAAKGFSAVGYFFAARLEESLHVPVGIIESAWPGSSGEEWTDTESLSTNAILKPILDRWDASPAAVRSFGAEPAPVDLEFDDFELLPEAGSSAKPLMLSDFDNNLSTTSTGGIWTYGWKDAPQTTFSMVSPGRDGNGSAIRVNGRVAELDDARLEASLKPQSETADLSGYSGLRFWARGEGEFRLQALQPTITDTDNYESATIKATPEWKPVTIWFKDLKQEGWGVVEPLTMQALNGFSVLTMPDVGYPDRPPAGLYEGMIVPIEPYRVRGVIWYQGEGNGWRGYQYRSLLPALIHTWRTAWGEGDFPFLIVELPNYGTSPELGNSLWAELREAQFLASKTLPNTGLIVTIDVGNPKNLHPTRKQPVGDRLAQWALGTTYGQKAAYSGPLYESMKVEKNEIRIGFRSFGSQLVARGGVLKGFSIAGADRKFHWADARIHGDTVIVSSPDVPDPVAVRYDWANSPDGNLCNAGGLPASPFRTDDWPGETYDAR
ncbi:MAG: sialate O-acetylesterase [Candidatus Acidiferrales bacterium]